MGREDGQIPRPGCRSSDWGGHCGLRAMQLENLRLYVTVVRRYCISRLPAAEAKADSRVSITIENRKHSLVRSSILEVLCFSLRLWLLEFMAFSSQCSRCRAVMARLDLPAGSISPESKMKRCSSRSQGLRKGVSILDSSVHRPYPESLPAAWHSSTLKRPKLIQCQSLLPLLSSSPLCWALMSITAGSASGICGSDGFACMFLSPCRLICVGGAIPLCGTFRVGSVKETYRFVSGVADCTSGRACS